MPFYNWMFLAAFAVLFLALTQLVQLSAFWGLVLMSLAACLVALGLWEMEREDSRG